MYFHTPSCFSCYISWKETGCTCTAMRGWGGGCPTISQPAGTQGQGMKKTDGLFTVVLGGRKRDTGIDSNKSSWEWILRKLFHHEKSNSGEGYSEVVPFPPLEFFLDKAWSCSFGQQVGLETSSMILSSCEEYSLLELTLPIIPWKTRQLRLLPRSTGHTSIYTVHNPGQALLTNTSCWNRKAFGFSSDPTAQSYHGNKVKRKIILFRAGWEEVLAVCV